MDALGLIGFAQANNYSIKMLNTEAQVSLGPKVKFATGAILYPYYISTSNSVATGQYGLWKYTPQPGSGEIFVLLTRTGKVRYILYDTVLTKSGANSDWYDEFPSGVASYVSSPSRRYPLNTLAVANKGTSYGQYVPSDSDADVYFDLHELNQVDKSDDSTIQTFGIDKAHITAKTTLFVSNSIIYMTLEWNFWPIDGVSVTNNSSFSFKATLVSYLKAVVLTPN